MSAIKLSTPSSGSISLSPANTASNLTITVPAVTATMATLTTPSFVSTIGVGGATPAASGAGITFPTTQSASSDANTLDDYEEGTWSTTVSGQVNITGTPTLANARYTKIGNLVSLEGTFTAVVTSSNQITYWLFTAPFLQAGNASGACGCAKQENLYVVGAVSDSSGSSNNQFYLSFSTSAQLPSGSSAFSFSLTYVSA